MELFLQFKLEQTCKNLKESFVYIKYEKEIV